jgi:parallel beta-helix repeat protein
VVGGSSALVRGNVVEDFKGEAIVGSGLGTTLTARDNTIHYWHEDAEGPVARGGRGKVDCDYGAGIVIGGEATGTIEDNAIVGLPSAGTTTSLMCPGIYLESGGDGIVVRDNLVRYAFDGINTGGANEAIIEDNVIRGSRNDGLLVIASRRAIIEDNLVRGSWMRGIFVRYDPEPPMVAAGYVRGLGGIDIEPRNNTFRSNQSVDNDRQDCRDESIGTKTLGTDNTWVANTSDGADFPNGICPRA